MLSFQEVFPKGRAFLAVVHVQTEEQALRNAEIAFEGGADGIFLITHGSVSVVDLLHIYYVIKKAYPGQWIGVNFLGLTPLDALLMVHLPGASGLWTDNAGIDLMSKDPAKSARLFWGLRTGPYAQRQGLYFGGVAFKYQEPVRDVARAAKLAMLYMDVITTSGEATGSQPAVEKIRAMREAIGVHPLAIASGITPENVGQYLDIADVFLVATGVSSSFTELNPRRVKKLAQIVSGA